MCGTVLFDMDSSTSDIFQDIDSSTSDILVSWLLSSPHNLPKSPHRRPNSVVVCSCICFCIASKRASVLSACHPSDSKISAFCRYCVSSTSASVVPLFLPFPVFVLLFVVFLLLQHPFVVVPLLPARGLSASRPLSRLVVFLFVVEALRKLPSSDWDLLFTPNYKLH